MADVFADWILTAGGARYNDGGGGKLCSRLGHEGGIVGTGSVGVVGTRITGVLRGGVSNDAVVGASGDEVVSWSTKKFGMGDIQEDK